MSDTQDPSTPSDPFALLAVGGESPIFLDSWTSRIDTLLDELQQLTQTPPVAPILGREVDNQLVQVRLGIASSLFTALRYKHPPAAAHSLRVALTCSAWCSWMNMADEVRDKIEVAALLHDLGLIGVPDQVLQKPDLLDADEAAIIERSRHMNVEILRASCAEPIILEIVEYAPARFDGARPGYAHAGEAIPLGARIVSIVESYDAMTTERAFRPARSQESAMAELFSCAGSQFDPKLVKSFDEFCRLDQNAAREQAARRWLRTLDPRMVDRYWRHHHAAEPSSQLDVKRLFEMRLLDNMHDAVIFIDDNLTIQLWNSGAERMTGISSKSVCQKQWMPGLLNLRDEKGHTVDDEDCPIDSSIRSGVQSLRRLLIWGRNGRPVPVDTHVIPVMAENGTARGAVLVLHDASSEISLEKRCQNLYDKAITDPLTRVANRAEFDRVHEMFVAAHSQRRMSCSLIIGDLDLFKQVNDNYGHQAGDEVIKTLANLLKTSCRTGDLVARYGGEEFVMLCTDCDNATAARRAEEVRYAMARATHSLLDGRNATVSFGVTEIQPGDTPETMLRRADRALLMAKAKGRNRVVQLGSGSTGGQPFLKRDIRPTFAEVTRDNVQIEQEMVTVAPIAVTIEKLRGFVADHRARILETDHNQVQLLIEHHQSESKHRRNDRTLTFLMEIELTEEKVDAHGEPAGGIILGENRVFSQTRVHVKISPQTKRDRRNEEVMRRARDVLVSLRSYLMATHEHSDNFEANMASEHIQQPLLSDRLRVSSESDGQGVLAWLFGWLNSR